MSVESSPQPNDHPATKPCCCTKISEQRERFWDLKASHWVGVFLTVVLIGVGWLQYRVYTRQANIMEIEQRPWISVDMNAVSAPTFDEANNRIFTVGYTLKNVGKSPAFNVDFIADAIQLADIRSSPPPSSGYAYASPEKAINAAVESTCGASGTFSEIMFPDVPENKRWRVHLSPVKSGFIPGFAIIGCVTYKFFNNTEQHSSSRVFDLESKAYGQMIDLSRTDIPLDELVFFPHPENGSRAN